MKVKVRVAQSHVESAKKGEERASIELQQLREELSRQDSLSSSIQRIEATLCARKTASDESYKNELAVLSTKLSEQTEDCASEVRGLKQELNDHELRFKLVDDERQKAGREALEAKKELLEASSCIQVLEERIKSLESDISAANQKLAPLKRGDPMTELHMKVESLTENLKCALQQNGSLKEQVTALKEVSKGSEDAVLEMTDALKIARASRKKDLSTLQEQLTVATTELEKMKQLVSDLTKDLSIQREEREQSVRDGKSKLVEAEAQAATLRCDAENARRQCMDLHSEISQLRSDALNAQVCTAYFISLFI